MFMRSIFTQESNELGKLLVKSQDIDIETVNIVLFLPTLGLPQNPSQSSGYTSV